MNPTALAAHCQFIAAHAPSPSKGHPFFAEITSPATANGRRAVCPANLDASPQSLQCPAPWLLWKFPGQHLLRVGQPTRPGARMGVFGAQTLGGRRFLCDYEGGRVPYSFLEEATQTVIYGSRDFIGSLFNEGFDPLLVNTEFFFNRRRGHTGIRVCHHCEVNVDEEALLSYGEPYWEFDERISRDGCHPSRHPELEESDTRPPPVRVFVLSASPEEPCMTFRLPFLVFLGELVRKSRWVVLVE